MTTAALERVRHALDSAVTAGRPVVSGEVDEVRGLSVRVRGLSARVGDLVLLSDQSDLPAEVVSVQNSQHGQLATCLPLGPLNGIGAGDRVVGTGLPMSVRVGDELLGRVLDG